MSAAVGGHIVDGHEAHRRLVVAHVAIFEVVAHALRRDEAFEILGEAEVDLVSDGLLNVERHVATAFRFVAPSPASSSML